MDAALAVGDGLGDTGNDGDDLGDGDDDDGQEGLGVGLIGWKEPLGLGEGAAVGCAAMSVAPPATTMATNPNVSMSLLIDFHLQVDVGSVLSLRPYPRL